MKFGFDAADGRRPRRRVAQARIQILRACTDPSDRCGCNRRSTAIVPCRAAARSRRWPGACTAPCDRDCRTCTVPVFFCSVPGGNMRFSSARFTTGPLTRNGSVGQPARRRTRIDVVRREVHRERIRKHARRHDAGEERERRLLIEDAPAAADDRVAPRIERPGRAEARREVVQCRADSRPGSENFGLSFSAIGRISTSQRTPSARRQAVVDLPLVLREDAVLGAGDDVVRRRRHADLQAIGIGARIGGVEVRVARRERERAVQRAGVVDVERRVDDSWRRISDRGRRACRAGTTRTISSSWYAGSMRRLARVLKPSRCVWNARLGRERGLVAGVEVARVAEEHVFMRVRQLQRVDAACSRSPSSASRRSTSRCPLPSRRATASSS